MADAVQGIDHLEDRQDVIMVRCSCIGISLFWNSDATLKAGRIEEHLRLADRRGQRKNGDGPAGR